MDITETIRDIKTRLESVSSSPDLDARLLLEAASGLTREGLIAERDRILTDDEKAKLEGLITRRLAHEPVSRILGEREFWSLPFKVTKDTLDPRPDSETLVEVTLKKLNNNKLKNITILDLGTGTGCLLLSLLHELPAAQGVGIDVSPGAIETATQNAHRLGLENRAQFITADWKAFKPENRFDIVISNPPYIAETERPDLAPEVVRFDPASALFGGEDGLRCYHEIAAVLPNLLQKGGFAVLETGFRQAAQIKEIFGVLGFSTDAPFKDLSGNDRCLVVTA